MIKQTIGNTQEGEPVRGLFPSVFDPITSILGIFTSVFNLIILNHTTTCLDNTISISPLQYLTTACQYLTPPLQYFSLPLQYPFTAILVLTPSTRLLTSCKLHCSPRSPGWIHHTRSSCHTCLCYMCMHHIQTFRFRYILGC